MTDRPLSPQPAWRIGRSIALELDVALSYFGVPEADREAVPHARVAAANVPDSWAQQWPELLGPRRRWVNILADFAYLTGVLEEEEYSRATLAMRELTLEGALAAMTQRSAHLGITPDAGLPPAERLVDLAIRSVPAQSRVMGLEMASEERFARGTAAEAKQAVRLLKGGDLHSRFWLWIDEFYFQWYRPWREEQLPAMEAQEQHAIAALGARAGDSLPDLSWLPPQNALIHRQGIVQAAEAGKIRVVLWTEPFGFFDYWSHNPDMTIVSYTQASTFFDSFRAEAAELAERVKALSDGSRLSILRIIRQYAMDNTQMADYLGLARPTVSIHAKLLREAGLIETRAQGRAAVHTVNTAEVRKLLADLERFLRLPDQE